jgi:segregation and condensation protein A
VHISLEQFQGPLDLLLTLIEKNKLDISKISLVQITDQYVTAVYQNTERGIENLIYFLELASRLIILKTRLLLPYLNPQEDDEDDENLVQMLRLYKEYRGASLILLSKWNTDALFCKERVSAKIARDSDANGEFPPIAIGVLAQTMEHLLKKSTVHILPAETLKRVFNIKDKISHIQEALKKSQKIFFKDLLANRSSHAEFIITFIAILELCKKNYIYVTQKEAYTDIHIHDHFLTT